jgi:hypothetical protein
VASQLELPRNRSGTGLTEIAKKKKKKYLESITGLAEATGLILGPSERRTKDLLK